MAMAKTWEGGGREFALGLPIHPNEYLADTLTPPRSSSFEETAFTPWLEAKQEAKKHAESFKEHSQPSL